MEKDLVEKLMECATFGAEGAEHLCFDAAMRILSLEKALRKIVLVDADVLCPASDMCDIALEALGWEVIDEDR